ncbi:MAG TPA: hypothetical protein VIK01_02695, partial [Polyangiaceae bacterium]
QSFVMGALEAAHGRAAKASSSNTLGTPVIKGASKPPKAPMRRWRMSLLAAASLGLFAGLAAANTETVSEVWRAVRHELVALVVGVTPGAAPSALASSRTPKLPAPAGHVEHTSVAAAAIAGVAVAVPSAAVEPSAPLPRAAAVVRAAEPAARQSGDDSPLPVAPGSRASFATPEPLPAPGPATIFERANTARHDGNMVEARALYRELQSHYPRSPEALLSLATLARVDLDHGQAASALSGFEAYLASRDGALREQALSGRATTLWRMGRRTEEIQAWRALLAAYPGSAYGAIARERLDPDAQ